MSVGRCQVTVSERPDSPARIFAVLLQPTANMDAVQRDETLGPLNFKAGEECVNGLVIQSDDGGERERPAGGQTHRLSAMAARWGFLFL